MAQLTFLDNGAVPSSTGLRVWLGELQHHGFGSVRTGAVTDVGSDVLQRQGFEVLQTLRLLDLHLVGWRSPGPRKVLSLSSRRLRTHRLRVGERPLAAAIDRCAFGDMWAIDVRGIHETCQATPGHRARAADAHDNGPDEAGRGLVGYAITGRADRTGYLQRLAVRPSRQGQGFGFGLVRDSLTWMQRQRLSRAIVNTHADNQRALALYQRVGFRLLPQTLAVLTRSLTDI